MVILQLAKALSKLGNSECYISSYTRTNNKSAWATNYGIQLTIVQMLNIGLLQPNQV
jgi:hypothetical protein